MNANDSLATTMLRATGIYSDEALARIVSSRAANPGMGLAEAAVKFGGVKEKDFLSAVGRVLGVETVDLEKQNPSPDALQPTVRADGSSSWTVCVAIARRRR